MAIDPNIVTTVQVKELPPNPLHPEDNLVHEVGDQLSRHTLQELVDYIRSQSVSYAYEVKLLRPPSPEYITDNFDMTPGENQGLGKIDGLWSGWAICNGNNGTDNDDGITYIGYGANYATIGQFLGTKTETLTINQIPSHRFLNGVSNDNLNPYVYGGTTIDMPGLAVAEVRDEGGARTYQGYTNYIGGGQSHNNIQPSKVMLKIMKLP